MQNRHFRVHVIGLSHLPTSKTYNGCAFTSKNVKLCQMLLSMGHEVYLYGVGGSDVPCTEFIKVLDIADVKRQYGDGFDNELGYDYKGGFFRHNFDPPWNEVTLKYFNNCIKEINARKKPDDFLFCTMGTNHRPISEAVGLRLTCEPGVGYRGSFADYKAFESSFIQNFTYGARSGGESINGNNYDVVIPNYFDIKDFKYQHDKGNYYLYIGRIIQRKGVETAIKTCEAIGAHLIIAGQGGRHEGGIFYGEGFQSSYANIEYYGFANIEQRSRLMGGAKAVFVPTEYLEPFGGVSIEALLTGTPVICTNFGCFPETIPQGLVGYRCQTLDQFVWAAKNIDKIRPEACREYAERNYSMERVAEMYQEWMDSLYNLYESMPEVNKGLGWHRVTDRSDINWNAHFYPQSA